MIRIAVGLVRLVHLVDLVKIALELGQNNPLLTQQ